MCFLQGVLAPAIVTPFSMPGVQLGQNVEATRVLVLLNMVTKDELVNDDDYAGVCCYYCKWIK